jgi:hypothetical protein
MATGRLANMNTGKELMESKVQKVEGHVIDERDTSPNNLVALAIRQGSDVATIEKLLELRERNEKYEAEKAFHYALTQFKSEVPSLIPHDAKVDYEGNRGGKVNYRFTSLPAIIDHITAALSRYDLSVSWGRPPSAQAGMIRVSCTLTHILGYSQSVDLEAPSDNSGGKNPIQAVGSTVKYLQRYTLLMLLGLTTVDTDDADIPAQNAPVSGPEQTKDLEARVSDACNGEAVLISQFVRKATNNRANSFEEARKMRLLAALETALKEAPQAAPAPAVASEAAMEALHTALLERVGGDPTDFIANATGGKATTWEEVEGNKDHRNAIRRALRPANSQEGAETE